MRIDELTRAVQRDARPDRRPGHGDARRARQRLARSAHAADAAARRRRRWRSRRRPTPSVTARRWPIASRSRDRVLVMLNTLMDISEAESGAMPLQRETMPLGRRRSSAPSTCIATSPKRRACRCSVHGDPAVGRVGGSRAARTGGRQPDRQRREVHAARRARRRRGPARRAIAPMLARRATPASASPPTSCRASGSACSAAIAAAPSAASALA